MLQIQQGIALPTGASGHKIPYLDVANTWSAVQTISVTDTSVPLTLISTDAGATASPFLDKYRNSASPAASDLLGAIRFYGKDAGAAQQQYGQIHVVITDVTAGSEDAYVDYQLVVAGTLASRLQVAAGVYHASATGTDKGDNTLNFGTLYENGTSLDAKYGALASGNYWSLAQNIAIAAAGTFLTLTSSDAGAAVGPRIDFFRNSASPAASDDLGNCSFLGNNSTPTVVSYAFLFTSIVDPTAASEDSSLTFYTYVAGTPASRMILGGGLYHVSATGTDKGNNTINFGAVYDDNVLLTSQPASAEFLETGTIDVAAWDAIVPGDREHTTAHIFQDLLDTGFDPREPEQFVAKFRADEVLPGMPAKEEFTVENHNVYSIGEIFSRLWLAVDMMGVAFSAVTDRLVAAEARIAQLEGVKV